MYSGGSKFEKTVKTKFKKNEDREFTNKQTKPKHHDKSFYRLKKQEEKEYDL